MGLVVRQGVWVAVVLVVGGGAVLGMGVARGEGGDAGGGDAVKVLGERLGEMKDVRTLHARFVCEKDLALLETPLVSSGEVWIRRGGEGEKEGGAGSGAAVRFSTEKPYVSELILVEGKVYARSQHEESWSKSNQSSRPGLTAVMGQLGGWATGDAGKVSQMYSVALAAGKEAEIPAVPKEGGELHVEAGGGGKGVDVFVLTPTNEDLAKAVKKITLAVDRGTGGLEYISIETEQGDVTRYWFGDVERNGELPKDVFEAKEGEAR
ncbi:MAG TPA: outer membrane lipoprotein carrier protein LolA [Phycisphaerae bacterium]|nr:outer membrane lipoprotein carrier protein LolA [Phycisphaerae bacterium]